MTQEEVIETLLKGGVDLSQYGTPGRKTLGDLCTEVANLEVGLYLDRGSVMKESRSVKAHIYGGPRLPIFRLREYKRKFKRDGSVLYQLEPWGFSETLRQGETYEDAFKRGMGEEFSIPDPDLGILFPLEAWNVYPCLEPRRRVEPRPVIKRIVRPSRMYPGVTSVLTYCEYTWEQPPEYFKSKHTVEEEQLFVYARWFRA